MSAEIVVTQEMIEAYYAVAQSAEANNLDDEALVDRLYRAMRAAAPAQDQELARLQELVSGGIASEHIARTALASAQSEIERLREEVRALKADAEVAVQALKSIEHATAVGFDDAYHESAWALARRALSDMKWGAKGKE